MRRWCTVFVVLVVTLLGASAARACLIEGYIYCDSNQNRQLDPEDKGIGGVRVDIVNADGTFAEYSITDETGYYRIVLVEGVPDIYRVSVDMSTLPADAAVLVPALNANGEYVFSESGSDSFQVDWLISSASCFTGKCWLTGGGVKFEAVTNLRMAERGPQHTLGGNVNPGCSPTAGDGGQWNDVDHYNKLHFQGTAIQVTACGNVPGIPAGSESPQTPYNYIEFQGTGWVHGIKGNKADYPFVYFYARCEDRNEPGSKGARAGALIDRYFLWVYTDPLHALETTLMLVDQDGNAGTMDPILITGGNLQIHISSCDTGGGDGAQLPTVP